MIAHRKRHLEEFERQDASDEISNDFIRKTSAHNRKCESFRHVFEQDIHYVEEALVNVTPRLQLFLREQLFSPQNAEGRLHSYR